MPDYVCPLPGPNWTNFLDSNLILNRMRYEFNKDGSKQDRVSLKSPTSNTYLQTKQCFYKFIWHNYFSLILPQGAMQLLYSRTQLQDTIKVSITGK
jgi:hypothetical protein